VADIELRQVTKRYHDGTEAIKGINLTINDGELMILVGPSGCGKTTALRMLAGLEEITSGTIRIAGQVVNHLPPKKRDIAMVFQSYALYPHMTVRANMGFALRLAKVKKSEIARRVRDAAATLDLTEHLDRKPANLSGGQRQRVAMGRAIVRDPAAFLMDEPLSNLDAKLRVQMRIEIARLQQRLGTTTVYVTHDQTEAMTLGDRVAVMRGGLVQQVDAPQRLYEDPANLFVAGFIGSPPMNLLPARVSADRIELPFGAPPLPGELRARLSQGPAMAEVIAGIRPEAFGDGAIDGEHTRHTRFTTKIDVVEAMGPEVYAYFDVPCRSQLPTDLLETPERRDQPVLGSRDDVRQVVARLPVASRVAAGQEATLTFDPDGLSLFDPQNGDNLLQRPSAARGPKNGVEPGAHTLRADALGDVTIRPVGGVL
jgi:multiple sugar transport system ATP-binding protein